MNQRIKAIGPKWIIDGDGVLWNTDHIARTRLAQTDRMAQMVAAGSTDFVHPNGTEKELRQAIIDAINWKEHPND